VTRDAAIAGGTVTLQGTVGRNARIAGGRVEIAGAVNGDLLIRAQQVIVLPSAVIGGNFTYSSEQPAQIAPGARVTGKTLQEPYPIRPVTSREMARGFRIAFGIIDFFWMLALVLVLLAIAPGLLQATGDTLRGRPWAALGWGALLLLAIPPMIVALLVTVVGIPIGALALLAYALAISVGHATAALAVGQFVAPHVWSPYAEGAIGVGLVTVATNLPYVGWWLRLIVLAAGFGALLQTLWGRRAPASPPSRPVPAGPAVA
jgi:hypothetical protein